MRGADEWAIWMEGEAGWMDGVVQVVLPGIMQPQPQVLMAYKSLGLIFYSAKERDCQVNTYVPRGCRNTELCERVCVSESEWRVNTHSILRCVNSRKHFRVVC